MVPVIKSAMMVIVRLESDEQNGYAFQASFGELNESKKLDGFFSLFWDKIRGIKWEGN
jgi:hypothetical protein